MIREEVRMVASAEIINTITMNIIMIITCRYPGLGGGMPGMNGPGIGCCAAAHYKDARMIKDDHIWSKTINSAGKNFLFSNNIIANLQNLLV